MDIVLYMGFSILEVCAMFYMIFRIFKIDIMVKEFIFASAIMAFISYVLRAEYQLPYVDVMIQASLMLSFMWMLFRIHIFYATILTGMAYQIYMLIQTIYYFLLVLLAGLNEGVPLISDISTYLMQTLSAFTAFLIGGYIHRKRLGFIFVPDKPRGKLQLRRRDIILFALNLPALGILSVALYFVTHYSTFFYVFPIGYAIILSAYLYISYKKDMEDYG